MQEIVITGRKDLLGQDDEKSSVYSQLHKKICIVETGQYSISIIINGYSFEYVLAKEQKGVHVYHFGRSENDDKFKMTDCGYFDDVQNIDKDCFFQKVKDQCSSQISDKEKNELGILATFW